MLRQRKNQGQLNHNPAESVIIDHLRLEYGKIEALAWVCLGLLLNVTRRLTNENRVIHSHINASSTSLKHHSVTAVASRSLPPHLTVVIV